MNVLGESTLVFGSALKMNASFRGCLLTVLGEKDASTPVGSMCLTPHVPELDRM
jgi:hypothetical protein